MKQGGDGEESLISDLENGEWQEVDGSESRQKMKWWHGQLSHPHRRAASPANQSLSEKAASYWVSLGRQHTGTHARTHAHAHIQAQRLNPHSNHFQALPNITSFVLLSDLQAGTKKRETQSRFIFLCLVCSSPAWRRDIVANRKRVYIFVWHKTELECGVVGVAVMMTCLMVWSIGMKTPPKMTDVEAALLWVSLPQVVLLRRWRMVQKARLINTFFCFVFSAPSEKHIVVSLC